MAVVGGGQINVAFLSANLLDEISLLIGAGIDGREGMCSVFDGLKRNHPLTLLKLEKVKAFKSSSLWLRYKMLEK